MDATIGPYPLSGVRMPTWLLPFDKHGACKAPATRLKLLERLRTAPPSDVIVFAHGWNNSGDDAADMYAEFLCRFEAQCASHAPGRPFDPLFIGVLWPSIWLSFDSGPLIASGGLAGQADVLLTALADRVAASGGAAGLERVYALLAAPAIDDADAAELARLIAPAFGVSIDEGAALQGRDTVADDVLAMMRAMELAHPSGHQSHSDDIDDYRRPPDAVDAGGVPGGVRVAGLLSKFDPRNALRLFSLYQMKDRAGRVGFEGVSALLREVLAVPAAVPGGAAARVHLVGHSFGCKVLLSALCARPLPRAVASLLLLQPAVSHLCFADHVAGTGQPGGYREALSADRVTQPIFSTYSRKDLPLHTVFHLAMRRAADLGEAQIAADPDSTSAGAPPSRFAALGGYGPRRAGQVLIDPLPAAGDDFVLPTGEPAIVAFDGTKGAIKGHSDITGPEVARLCHRLLFRAEVNHG